MHHLDRSTRFYRDVIVDGVLYGYIEADHRGMHGVRYVLRDSSFEYVLEKKLLSPGQIAAALEEYRKRAEAHFAEAEKKKRDEFDARAAKAVEILPEKYRAKMIAPILEAMQWAESR